MDRGIRDKLLEGLRGVEVMRYWRNRIGMNACFRGIRRDYMGWNRDVLGCYLFGRGISV